MFLLADGALVTSASDLTLASKCEFAFLRQLDFKLGRIEGVPVLDDPMLARAGALGDEHETRVVEAYRADLTGVVVEIGRPSAMTREGLRAAAEETRVAFEAGAELVYQATFFDETVPAAPFVGFADFIVRRPDGRYRVQDSKLARSPKVTALLQLAAYQEQLERIGVPTDEIVELILGDGSRTEHHIDEIAPVFRNRRERLREMIAEHRAEQGPVQWGDDRYGIDGRCEHCEPEVVAARDLLLVAGIRVTQRAKLIDVGIRTIDELAATPIRPAECPIPDRTYAGLRAQAALQLAAPITDDPHAVPPFELFAPEVMSELPKPDAGDIFFDFEGDPLYREGDARESLWGIDYLWGLVDTAERYTAFWAHDMVEEKGALLDFLAFVSARRVEHPDLHIYHYASYERTHLLNIAARNGVGEEAVDELLRDGVLVDLYPVVKKSLRIGGRSYSIKKLEPLYMGDEHRADDGVTTGADSIAEYARSRDALAAGDPAEAQRVLDRIADYNRYDCVSTLRLRDWLLSRAAEQGVAPASAVELEIDRVPFEPSPLGSELSLLAERATRDGDSVGSHAYALASAAIDYHRREAKSFWWEHFARLTDPIDEWADTRGVLIADRVEIVEDWEQGERQRVPHRLLRAHGTWAPGSGAPRGDAFALYNQPAPFDKEGRRAGSRLDTSVRIRVDPENESAVLIDEGCPVGQSPWTDLPVALTPAAPPNAGSQVSAIEQWGWHVVNSAPGWMRDPAVDILRRRAPKVLVGELEPALDADLESAVLASLRRLDQSYLAVQGPPGTGKTHLAAHVIAALVADHHWKIGVVAQSHKVVENVLDAVVRAGLDPALVAKTAPSELGPGGYESAAFTELPKNGHSSYAAEHAQSGFVVGGTAWDFTNLGRFQRKQLDLLVVDEAGQFALAPTIAVSVSARRLLLLGDPQQLPQVSQGTHPAPIDDSALGFISDGHDVLPSELGYFLAESRRMDAAVTLPVSRLAYDGALRSHASTRARQLEATPAGLHPVAVDHRGNATSSVEEASAVVGLVSQHLGRLWTDPEANRQLDPLTPADIIVVTPYNAQVETIRTYLDAAGLHAVRVGTVDKFQGQEAVISIVSLAASSPLDVPRGLSFLLSRNRLNVAISRAQWAAYLVHSPVLTETLPWTAEGVAELSRFIDLVETRSPAL